MSEEWSVGRRRWLVSSVFDGEYEICGLIEGPAVRNRVHKAEHGESDA